MNGNQHHTIKGVSSLPVTTTSRPISPHNSPVSPPEDIHLIASKRLKDAIVLNNICQREGYDLSQVKLAMETLCASDYVDKSLNVSLFDRVLQSPLNPLALHNSRI